MDFYVLYYWADGLYTNVQAVEVIYPNFNLLIKPHWIRACQRLIIVCVCKLVYKIYIIFYNELDIKLIPYNLGQGMTTFFSPKIHPPPISRSVDKITPEKECKWFISNLTRVVVFCFGTDNLINVFLVIWINRFASYKMIV